MPKSRGRRNRRKTQRVTKRMIDARTREILEGQRQRFREKFGREIGPNDPLFFDPDASEPSPMSAVKIEADVIEAMRKAGTPPQIVYAYKKTGPPSDGGDARALAEGSCEGVGRRGRRVLRHRGRNQGRQPAKP